jgi:hypothetical protein
MKNSRPGTWLEQIFALEVFRFSNIKHSVEAYWSLKARGLDPRPHAVGEVNLILATLEMPEKPAARILPIPATAPSPTPRRDARIRLFAGADGNTGESLATPR